MTARQQPQPERNPEEEINKMRELEERIKAPSIWGRIPCGLRFEDLQDRRYEEAVRFLKNHYLNEELTYKSLNILEDKEGTDEFIHNARIWMKDKMSIAVIKEGEDKLVGLLIMRIQEKNGFTRTFSRVKLTYNPIYSTIMKFYNEIEKLTNIFTHLGVRRYLKIYVLALKNRYRHRGIGKELIKASMNLAASAFIPGMAGIFTTGRLQQIGEELGFEKLNEIYYVRYHIDDKIVFWDTGLGNYGAAIMAVRIPDVEEPDELVAQMSSRFNVKHQEGEEVGKEGQERVIEEGDGATEGEERAREGEDESKED